jgi:molybdate transport system substrate-binding protein
MRSDRNRRSAPGFRRGSEPGCELRMRRPCPARGVLRKSHHNDMFRGGPMKPAIIAAVLALCVAPPVATAARATEIVILANQGAVSGLRDLAPAFEKATGIRSIIKFEPGPEMAKAIDGDLPADLVSNILDQFDGLVKRGKVAPGSFVEYARAGNGVAVKAGAPKPDISTPEAFKQAMLNAKSIGHSNNGTGPFNTTLFKKLGIYDQIKDRIKIIDGRPIAQAVAAGDVEIGIQQTNVIQPVAGSDYVGPLPPELIEYGHFGIGVLTISKEPEAARAFVKFATSPEAAPLLRKSAMEPPAK